jgi:L-iditol 2-dehydrogenase
MKLGDIVAILGAGPIGLLFVQMAQAAGASKVILADLLDHRLELGRELGADVLINASKANTREELLRTTGGVGADLVIEAAGVPGTIRDSISVVKNEGNITLFGVPAEPIRDINMDLVVTKSVCMKGFIGARYSEAIDLLASGTVSVKKLITHTFGLDRIDHAYRVAVEKTENVMKILLKP